MITFPTMFKCFATTFIVYMTLHCTNCPPNDSNTKHSECLTEMGVYFQYINVRSSNDQPILDGMDKLKCAKDAIRNLKIWGFTYFEPIKAEKYYIKMKYGLDASEILNLSDFCKNIDSLICINCKNSVGSSITSTCINELMTEGFPNDSLGALQHSLHNAALVEYNGKIVFVGTKDPEVQILRYQIRENELVPENEKMLKEERIYCKAYMEHMIDNVKMKNDFPEPSKYCTDQLLTELRA